MDNVEHYLKQVGQVFQSRHDKQETVPSIVRDLFIEVIDGKRRFECVQKKDGAYYQQNEVQAFIEARYPHGIDTSKEVITAHLDAQERVTRGKIDRINAIQKILGDTEQMMINDVQWSQSRIDQELYGTPSRTVDGNVKRIGGLYNQHKQILEIKDEFRALIEGGYNKVNDHGDNRFTIDVRTHVYSNIERGHTREYIIARLKRDDKDLAARVVSGELSAHKAMNEYLQKQGLRPTYRPTLNLNNLETFADYLKERMTIDEIMYLIEALQDGN